MRTANILDLEWITDLAVEATSRGSGPKPDRPVVRDAVAHYLLDSEAIVLVDGEACVIVDISPMLFCRGYQATVIMFYSRSGNGGKLLREMSHMCKARGVKLVVFSVEYHMGQRLARKLERLGIATGWHAEIVPQVNWWNESGASGVDRTDDAGLAH